MEKIFLPKYILDKVVDDPILNKNELLEGKKYGYHIVTEPLTGYKKINCVHEENSEEYKSDAIAELEIPIGATVIRAYEYDEYLDHPISHKLRTDRVIVRDIKPYPDTIQNFNVEKYTFSSFQYPEYKYYIGKEQRPIEQFNRDFTTACESGIHFFLDKILAERYDVLLGEFHLIEFVKKYDP